MISEIRGLVSIVGTISVIFFAGSGGVGVADGAIGGVGGTAGVVAGVIVAIALTVIIILTAVDILIKYRKAWPSGGAPSRAKGGGRTRPFLRQSMGSITTSDLRRLLTCLTVDRLVDYLLTRAARRLPERHRDRWAEEWADHRGHRTDLRLLWWTLCVWITAFRIAHELEQARLACLED